MHTHILEEQSHFLVVRDMIASLLLRTLFEKYLPLFRNMEMVLVHSKQAGSTKIKKKVHRPYTYMKQWADCR